MDDYYKRTHVTPILKEIENLEKATWCKFFSLIKVGQIEALQSIHVLPWKLNSILNIGIAWGTNIRPKYLSKFYFCQLISKLSLMILIQQ